MGLDVRNFVFITEDLILDRLRPDQREGKLLLDLEDVHNFNCLINEPSRATTCSQTQLDVILTNKPEDFKCSGVLDPELSDHAMVYGLMKCRVKHHPRKVFSFRDYVSMDQERLKEDLVTTDLSRVCYEQHCVVAENVYTPPWMVFSTTPPHPLGISTPGGILVPPSLLEFLNF